MIALIFKYVCLVLYTIYRPIQKVVMLITGFSRAFANITVIVLCIFIWIFTSMVWRDASFVAPTPIRPIQIKISTSIAKAVSPKIRVPATLNSDASAQVVAEYAGRVIKTYVKSGSRVKKGQALVVLDPGSTQSALMSKKAILDKAKLSLDVEKKLKESGLSSKEQLSSLQATYNSAYAAYRVAYHAYRSTTVRSPFNGVVEDRLVNVGDFATKGKPVVTFTGSKKIKVVTNLALNVAQRLRKGSKIKVSIDDSHIISATIYSIGKTTDANTGTVRVEATPEKSIYIRDLISGHPVEAEIQLPVENTHVILQSVLNLDPEGRLGLYIVDDDAVAHFKQVEIIDEEDGQELVSGLPNNIKYISYGFARLRDGMSIKPLLENKETTRKKKTKNSGFYRKIVAYVRTHYVRPNQKKEAAKETSTEKK